MCRIAGVWWWKNSPPLPALEAMLHHMAALQQHGGPDGQGVWLHPALPLGLAHRRLAILDLSPAGAQPMQRGSLILSYNGEIYNFLELRTQLQKLGYSFSTSSDTEVLLWGWAAWRETLLEKARGMWAFALWDGEALWLVRDRFGVKPLFYSHNTEKILLASEIPALLPFSSANPSPSALYEYLGYGYIASPRTFYEEIRQVPPGHYLRVQAGKAELVRYWYPEKIFFTGTTHPPTLEEAEVLLTESFQRRLVSDVPVGIFLSGGVDSSLVALLLRKHAKVELPTFTLGFEEPAYDEVPWAEKVAHHLKLPHFKLYIAADELLPLAEKLPILYGQPFGDASALAVYVLSQFARQKVKVVLSADGGDELFGGYVRHHQSYSFLRTVSMLLRSLSLSPDKLSGILPPFLFHNAAGKLLKLYYFQGKHYGELVQYVPEGILEQVLEKNGENALPPLYEKHADWREPAMRQWLDLMLYLPDDVLQKVDRATMAHALEAREPFLDPEVLALGGRLPNPERKGKGFLRRILYRYLPASLWKRPKQGFSPPLYRWLQGALRPKLHISI
ncbi:MAG: asparagine synthase (glutamine-hydrolyzing) [Bacteroidia bacterium]|nr:asparagine synthase (glutamine-hydrolyzing) [Bacteroidia bacterium]